MSDLLSDPILAYQMKNYLSKTLLINALGVYESIIKKQQALIIARIVV